MDIVVFGVLNVASIGFLIALIKRGPYVAIFPLFGGFLAVFTFLGLGSDGDLTSATSAGTGTNLPIASATLGGFTWEALTIIPLLIMLVNFLCVILRGFRKI